MYVDYDGKLLTKAYLARVKANKTHMSQIVAEDMSVHLFGSTAIAAGTYRVKDVYKRQLQEMRPPGQPD